jgi:dTDP-4-amino-4,6-dideoxygalactose transaminase
MEPYRSLQPSAAIFLPETERVAARIVVLPTGTSANAETIDTICRIIHAAVTQADAVRLSLSRHFAA